jgi:hypothetical protein
MSLEHWNAVMTDGRLVKRSGSGQKCHRCGSHAATMRFAVDAAASAHAAKMVVCDRARA